MPHCLTIEQSSMTSRYLLLNPGLSECEKSALADTSGELLDVSENGSASHEQQKHFNDQGSQAAMGTRLTLVTCLPLENLTINPWKQKRSGVSARRTLAKHLKPFELQHSHQVQARARLKNSQLSRPFSNSRSSLRCPLLSLHQLTSFLPHMTRWCHTMLAPQNRHTVAKSLR